jgi:hypothetical protein
MRRIITFIIFALALHVYVYAYKYSYDFKDCSVAEALVDIHSEHPDLKINFIYNELEDYRVSANVRADDLVEAIRQLVRFNPISVIVDSKHIYVEAMQHGKFRYIGRAVDKNGTGIPYASVILLTPKDSVMLTYGMTDESGRFSIPCDRKNVLVRLSGVGYATIHHLCSGFNTGDIIMPESAINLKGVTVTADGIRMTSDKMVIMVGNNVKRHSYDGYSALSLLRVPGINVDVFNGNVNANNSNVLICINGLAAERDEIKTLNPKDIIRVDYYTNFDPAHPNEGKVIDFIMKVRDYGGEVMAQDNQNLNRATGNGMLDWRMFRKKSEFGIRVTPAYNNFNPKVGSETKESLTFETGDIIRESKRLPSSEKSNSLSTKFTYIKHFDGAALKAATSLYFNHAKSRDDFYVRYQNLLDSDGESRIDKHVDQSGVSYNVEYARRLKNRSVFSIQLNGSYTHTDNTRDYLSNMDFMSSTKENYFRISPRGRFSIPLGNIFTPYIFAVHSMDCSKMHYKENGDENPSTLTFNQTIVEIGTNIKMNDKLSLTTRFQERVTVNNAGYGSKTSSFWTPGFAFSYRMPHNMQLYTGWFWGVNNPIFSLYTTDEKRIDEYMVRVGNPDLKMQGLLSADFSLSGSNNRLRYQLYSRYFNMSRAIYVDYTCDNERGVYVQSYKNGRNYSTFDVNVNGRFSIVPGIFDVGGAMQYKYSRSHTYTVLRDHGFPLSLFMDFTNNGFVGSIELYSQYWKLGQSGERISNPVRLVLNLGYNIDGWSFNFLTKNPFMRTCEKVYLDYPGVVSRNKKYYPRSDYNFFAVRISYRFNYGKKHKFDNVNVDENGNSAILNH